MVALLGNTFVWYDFALYGYLAADLGHSFFAANRPGLQALSGFSVFAVGFLMRPLGSLILGPLGDLLGRRLMLSLCIVIMATSSLLISLLPGYEQIGIWAPTALVLLRMLQGFSVGADLSGSITYAAEAAAQGRAGLVSSLVVAGGHLGFSLCSLTIALTTTLLSSASMASWGWRLPFLLGALGTFIGVAMRQRMPETLAPRPEDDSIEGPTALMRAVLAHLGEVWKQWRLVLQVMSLVSFANVVFYLGFFYLVDWTAQSSGQSAGATTIAAVVQSLGLVLAILGGLLVDRHGMVTVNRWASSALILIAPLALAIGLRGQLSSLTIALMLLVGPVMVCMAALGVLGAVLVPERQRCAVFSIAYSLATALFAGTAPLVAGWLQAQHWQALTPWLVMPFGAAALIAIDRSRHAGFR